MYIYLLFTLIIISIVAIYDITNLRIIYYLATILMCLFMGLRYKVGTDYVTYDMMFKSAKDTLLKNYEGDLGFLILSKIISFFTENTRVHFFIISSLIVILMMIYIYINSNLKFMSVLLYITICGYLTSFNVMRQWIAVAICAYAVNYVKKNKNIKYYIFIGIAYLFHATAIVFVPVKVLLDLKWKRKTYLIISFIGIILYLSIDFFMNLVNKFTRFGSYANGYYTNVGANVMFLIVFIIMFIFCYLNNNFLKNGINNIFLKISFLGLLFLFLGSKGLIFNRLAEYFNIGFIICIPEVLKGMYKKEKILFIYSIIICCLIYMLRFLSTNGNLIPYRIV
ncbi:EpsG family protein [Clostridium perfringens]|uniref:EpsG family protein n=1 Tax=Clostridium perfringens TaxID=1502 RepID=UPI0021AC6680|nr:EpsG family protein [Clostridium perfringens]